MYITRLPDDLWPDGPAVHDFTREYGGTCRRCAVHFLDAGPVCAPQPAAEHPPVVVTPGQVPPVAGGDEAAADATLAEILAAADAVLLTYIERHTDLAAVRARITGGQP